MKILNFSTNPLTDMKRFTILDFIRFCEYNFNITL